MTLEEYQRSELDGFRQAFRDYVRELELLAKREAERFKRMHYGECRPGCLCERRVLRGEP